ncbi:hypothetical protein PDIG_72070 [Penicillium digitatum PHI26]|uniref:Uncharacterized protein n=2 Tax=Penicillium digitatum TaxID=36651 RepID=K9FEG3_PEND2|nr:hypothetical protein PDIP_81340 [Penicillium digitatum Pd1]EKV05778.1 hypothetical protein PDIP_81340 [Penicillium digitatum Pd1]EKV07594.1 hypothetical protein PDIG_72070 [Penicillium digitatum PHI26]
MNILHQSNLKVLNCAIETPSYRDRRRPWSCSSCSPPSKAYANQTPLAVGISWNSGRRIMAILDETYSTSMHTAKTRFNGVFAAYSAHDGFQGLDAWNDRMQSKLL